MELPPANQYFPTHFLSRRISSDHRSYSVGTGKLKLGAGVVIHANIVPTVLLMLKFRKPRSQQIEGFRDRNEARFALTHLPLSGPLHASPISA